MQLWEIHNAEQLILDDMEINPDKYKGKSFAEMADEEDFDEENRVEYTKAYYKKALLQKQIVVRSLILHGIVLLIRIYIFFLEIAATRFSIYRH